MSQRAIARWLGWRKESVRRMLAAEASVCA